jgi:tetratricopeptide (TPR) repeat protein
MGIMARSDRRRQQKHGAQRHEPREQTQLTTEQQTQVESLLTEISTLAQALRAAAPSGEAALRVQLAPITDAPEPVARTYAARLGDARGPAAREAAEVAHALSEWEPRREVAREARRARLRLRSVGAHPTLEVATPAPPSAAPTPTLTAATAEEPAPPAVPLHAFGPRLVEGYVTRTREQGEVSLILGWQEGGDPNRVRGYIFRLSFWETGVRDFLLTDQMSRAQFLTDMVEQLSGQTSVEMVRVTWAQARRLVEEALDVKSWQGAAPVREFERHRSQINARLLDEPEDEERRADIAAEEERARREGDRPFIAADLEPEEVVGNWIGAWSYGDYALAYDLLADDHPLRRRQSRAEYIALRRRWAKEAVPDLLRLTLVREQARRAGALWVPGAAGALAGERKDVEAFWSLVLQDSMMGGQLDELPMATLTSQETGRHWYWTGYTLEHHRAAGLWLIARQRDEGAASQALTLDELQQRLREAHETVERLMQEAPSNPASPEAAEALRAVTGALTAGLHYSDALMVKLPLDESVYRTAVTDARSLGNHERAAALLEKMLGRFRDDITTRFQLGAEQYLTAEGYAQQGHMDAFADWMRRAVATLEEVARAEPTAEHLQGLGELLARQGHYDQAEARYREGLRLDPQRALLYSDLADSLMGRLSNPNLDHPEPYSEEERQRFAREALAALREANKLDASVPGVFTRIGAIYELLRQREDALLAFEEAVRRDPGDAEAHYALGSLLLQQQQPARAAHMMETAVQLNPVSVSYRLGLATAYALEGRSTEATRELDLVDRLQPGLPQIAELRALLARQKRNT